MRVEYGRFYRKNGVRKVNHFIAPPTMWYNKLQLPRNSSVHFPQYNDDDFEIPQDHFLAEGIKRYMFCEIVDHYDEEQGLGLYRLAPGSILPLSRKYFRMNKRIRPYFPDKPVHDAYTLVFHTYGLLNRRYVYMGKKRDTQLNRWKNHWHTVMAGVCREAEADDRHQFVVIDVPVQIPTLTRLKANGPLDVNTVRYFKTPDHWLTQSLWNFFTAPEDINGETPYIFQDVTDKAASKINIIWKSGNICAITNLQVLRSFNKAFEDKGKYDSLRFNKYLLNMFLTLAETDTVLDAEELEDADIINGDDEDIESQEDEEESIDADLDEEPEADDVDSDDSTNYSDADLDEMFNGFDEEEPLSDEDWVAKEKERDLLLSDDDGYATPTPIKAASKVKAMVTNGQDEIDKEVSPDDLIDSRLNALEDMQSQEEALDDEAEEVTSAELAYKTYEPELITTTDYDKIVIDTATQQARNGTLTAGELRLATKRAETYKTLKDPRDPKKAFVDNLVVTQEEISLDADISVANDVVKALVPDITMHQSSLKQFDRKYIKEVMPKHVAMTVMEVAKAGVTIQDYDIERVKNINDDFEIHSVRLTTIAGKQSTLRFRLPVVDESGQFKAGGVKLRMRKQWADKY